MRTVGEAVTQAREILQDEDDTAYRYSDSQLVSYFNNCTAELKRVRPDIFIFGEALPSFTDGELTEYFPFPQQYFQSFIYFMAGTAELRDDEFTVDSRAMTLIGRSTAMMVGS